jgi:hypothetical protein
LFRGLGLITTIIIVAIAIIITTIVVTVIITGVILSLIAAIVIVMGTATLIMTWVRGCDSGRCGSVIIAACGVLW